MSDPKSTDTANAAPKNPAAQSPQITSGTANAVPQTPAAQSPQIISGTANAVPQTPAAQSPQVTSDTAKAVSPTPPVFHSVLHAHTPGVTQGIQAAQSEHKLESLTDSNLVHGSDEPSDCALAGGATAPQSPLAAEPSPSAKKRRRKRSDNHISIRCDEDLAEIIARRMERTGETQSNAVRAIIRESEHNTAHVYLAPKAPPEQLETALGDLRKWRKDFVTAKPRLNIPTPKDDDSRYSQVQQWRKEADRLLTEIPKLEKTIAAAIAALTSLTPLKISILKEGYPLFMKWRDAAMKKGLEVGRQAFVYKAMLNLIEDMGLVEPQATSDPTKATSSELSTQDNEPQEGGE